MRTRQNKRNGRTRLSDCSASNLESLLAFVYFLLYLSKYCRMIIQQIQSLTYIRKEGCRSTV